MRPRKHSLTLRGHRTSVSLEDEFWDAFRTIAAQQGRAINDLAAEIDARALYKEAREYCRDAGDYVSMSLFETLMSDEEGHIDFLETQLDLYERIGEANYAQLNASKMDEGE